jgi:hypothetical protein
MPGQQLREVSLPAGVEELLLDVVNDGFTVYCCGPKAAPRALVASYEWQHCVDLLTIQDFARVVTARVPTQGRKVAPARLCVPRAQQRPMTIQLPGPGRAGVRAARLAAG